jgi:hypothetical protein
MKPCRSKQLQAAATDRGDAPTWFALGEENELPTN